MKPGIQLDLDFQFPAELFRYLPQHIKLPKAAERQDQVISGGVFHLPVQRKAHHHDLLPDPGFPELDPFRHMRNSKSVNPVTAGKKPGKAYPAQTVGVSFQNRDQAAFFSDYFLNFGDVLCNSCKINTEIRICFHK